MEVMKVMLPDRSGLACERANALLTYITTYITFTTFITFLGDFRGCPRKHHCARRNAARRFCLCVH